MECNIIYMFVSVCLYWLFGGFQINSRANHDDAVHSEVYSETRDLKKWKQHEQAGKDKTFHRAIARELMYKKLKTHI
jgi:hypothetical protein